MMSDTDALYWRCLIEIGRRKFSTAQRRVVQQVLDLTYRRGHADVQIRSLARLAVSVGSNRHNLQPVVDELVSKQIIGREEKAALWFLQPLDLWQIRAESPTDEERNTAAATATAAIIEADELRRRQREMFPEASGGDVATFITPVPENTPGVTKFVTLSTAALETRAPEPGNQKPDNQVRRGKGTGLDAAGWALLRELVEWCTATGETCSERQQQNWGWRAWTQPLVLEAALQRSKIHVAQERRCSSRFGLVKSFWRKHAGNDTLVSLPPRSTDRLHDRSPAPPASGVCTAAAPDAPPVAAPPPGALRRAVLEEMARNAAQGNGHNIIQAC